MWRSGYLCWHDLGEAIRGGATIRDLFHADSRQELLFQIEHGRADRRSAAWLDCLDASSRAIEEHNFRYFLDLINPANHWRLLAVFQSDALYLDIETTGLSRELH